MRKMNEKREDNDKPRSVPHAVWRHAKCSSITKVLHL